MIRYRVEVKLTSTTTKATSSGFSISKLRGIETIYVLLDPDFVITPETMEQFCELVRQEVPSQTLFWGDTHYKMWIRSYSPC